MMKSHYLFETSPNQPGQPSHRQNGNIYRRKVINSKSIPWLLL